MSNPTAKAREKEYQDTLGKLVMLRDDYRSLKIAHDSRFDQFMEEKAKREAVEKKLKEFEQQVYDMTATLDEHPSISPDDDDLWDGPCMCAECRSYGL